MSEKYANKENLERFWDNAKEYISNERKEIEDQLYNWQKTEKEGAVTFKPVPESDLEPVVDFMFTETPPVEGDKAPDNPSTITGVSSVNVGRCGKNLIKFPFAESTLTRGDTTYTVSDGTISVSGTASARSVFYITGSGNKIKYSTGDSFFISGTPANTPEECRMLLERTSRDGTYLGNYTVSSSGYNFVAQEDGYFTVCLVVNSGVTTSSVLFKPQAELGSTATTFEPYSGNNYIINLGNTYYGGSLDVATGVMTVTWAEKAFDGTENWSLSSYSTSEVNEFFVGTSAGLLPMSSTISNSTRYCSHFVFSTSVVANTFSTWGTTTRVMFHMAASDVADVTAFKAWLAAQNTNGTPVTVCYKLATPTTVQLTPTQIRSLSALDKYEPRINTIYSDQEAVQVGYQKYAGGAVKALGTTTARTLSEHFADIINVKDFGAKGDGVTDDGPAIQLALNAAGFIYFPKGTYVSRQQLQVSSNTYIFGGGCAEIAFTRQYSNYSGIHASGNVLDTAYTLTSNVVRGTKVIPLDSVSNFSVDDTVIIADNRPNLTSGSPEAVDESRGYNGEIHKIESVDVENSTITLYEGVWSEDFTTARSAFVRKMELKKNIHIEGIAIRSEADYQPYGIDLFCVENFFAKNVSFDGFYGAGIRTNLSCNGTIDNCTFKNIISSNVSLGYGILQLGSQHVVTRSCTAEMCGKLWDTGVGYWVDSNETEYHYVNTRFVTCRDSSIMSPLRCGISTHEPTEYVTIDNNFISIQNSQEHHAILCRSNNTTIINNSIVYGGRGLNDTRTNGISLNTTGKAGNVKISGNKIMSCVGFSVFVAINETNIDGYQGDVSYTPTTVIVSDNYIEPATYQSDSLLAAICLDGSRVNGDGCALITGNTIYRKDNGGSYGGILISGKINDVTISNNVIHGKRCVYVDGNSYLDNNITTSINIINVLNNYLADDVAGSISLANSTIVKKLVAMGNIIKPPYDSALISSNLPSASITANVKEKTNTLSIESAITGDMSINGDVVAGKEYTYPVGALYRSTVATSPENSAIVGFGTWTALTDEIIDDVTFHRWYRTA